MYLSRDCSGMESVLGIFVLVFDLLFCFPGIAATLADSERSKEALVRLCFVKKLALTFLFPGAFWLYACVKAIGMRVWGHTHLRLSVAKAWLR